MVSWALRCTYSILSLAGLELNSKKKKLEWETDDNDDEIDIDKTLELRQVRGARREKLIVSLSSVS